MKRVQVSHLVACVSHLTESKREILNRWIGYESSGRILKHHHIDVEYFVQEYASGVFEYFMEVIRQETEIGSCPVMTRLLEYLKDKEVTADELFVLCSHFRRAMIDSVCETDGSQSTF